MGLFKVRFFLEDLVLFLKVRFFFFFFRFMGLLCFFLETTDFFLGLVLLALNMCYLSDHDPRIP
jgi:hypothetical protein